MKIDVRPIISDHIATLCDDRTQRVSFPDLFLFYVTPTVVGIGSYCAGYTLDREAFNASITFFGIFVALLLNIQVAIFSIYQRKWSSLTDERSVEVQEEQLKKRRKLLGQLNANISYLVLVCCLALIVSLIAYAVNKKSCGTSAVLMAVYAHFLLTMMMVVKRSHVLFQREYVA